MAASTSHCPTIGKIILPSNISQLKDNWNSEQSSSSPNAHRSISSNPSERRTTSNFTSDVSSSPMTAKSSFRNGLASLKVLLTLRIFLSICPVRCCSRTRFSRHYFVQLFVTNCLGYPKTSCQEES